MRAEKAYSNLLIDELSGQLRLLRGSPDGEDAHVWVGVGCRVPLQLHMGPRLLVYILNGLSPWMEHL